MPTLTPSPPQNALPTEIISRPQDAAARMQALGVDYVAFCLGAPERYIYAAVAPGGLAAALAQGEMPTFLARVPLAGTDLAVYQRRR